MDRGAANLAPLMVSITGFVDGVPTEDEPIRSSLDRILASQPKKFSCKISASTIFPYEVWLRRGRPSVSPFSTLYLTQFLPRLRARDRHNGHGTYFERMVSFHGSKLLKGQCEHVTKNQLEHVISIWRRDRAVGRSSRHSALQITVFDPAKDHSGAALLGFPCLQQVSLSYDGHDGLAVSAFYPTQYIVDRAYGNYLGLCHLGCFLAHEMSMKMVRLNCFIGLPELGQGWTKNQLRGLADLIRSRFP